ncbi:O-antigen ligase family protein [Corticibacter populi]|nr:O-antigen ligase family protein [Corticibacter populi]
MTIAVLLGLVFGALTAVLAPGQLAVLLVGAAAAITVLRRPLWGLLLFAVVATFAPYTSISLGVRTTVAEALLALTWGGVWWQGLIGNMNGRLRWQPTERSLIWLMAYSALPFLVGMVMIHAEGNGPVNWVRWLLNLSTFFLIPLLVRSEHDRDQLVQALLLGCLLLLLLSVAVFLKDRNPMGMMPILLKMKYAHPEALQDIFSGTAPRMGSPWVHPNLTGGALALFIPLALFYGWATRGWRRLLGLSVAVLGCAGLLFSISRGAIVSLALVLLWLVYKRVPYSTRILGLGVAFALALVLFYPPLQERLVSMFSSSNASTEVRMEEYAMFPDAMRRYPLGIGFKVDPPVPGSGLVGISNLWLNYIYKIGIPGMLLFIVVTLLWWREVRPHGPITRVDAGNAVQLGATCGVMAALLTGIFDHYYSFTFVLVGLFWLMASMSLQLARQASSGMAPATFRPRP